VRSSTANKLLLGGLIVFLLLGVPVALAGGAEDRRTLLGVVVAAGTIGFFLWLNHKYRVRPRSDSMQAEAGRLGLRFSHDDRDGLLSLPFELFGRAATIRDLENVVSGSLRGNEVVLFDYHYAQGEDADFRFSCAMVPVPSTWPAFLIRPESGLSRAARDVGLRDIETESEAFNRTFEVRCPDPRFALALLEPRMMEWLLGLGPRTGFEIWSGRMLCFVPQVQPWEIESVLRTALAFRERIPPVVSSLYPNVGTPPRPDEPAS
jgi:hypothetical protein